jgi:hypothetical protein
MNVAPRAIVALCCLSALPAAVANILDGNELRIRCESTRIESLNTCMGYLAGVADAEDAAPSWRMEKPLFCLPRATSANELRQIIVAHFRAHPEDEDLNAAIVVGNAFVVAFPCN